jgi:hypothetical protein
MWVLDKLKKNEFNQDELRLFFNIFNSNLRSSGLLRCEEWQFLTDILGQPIGPIFKCQEILLEPKRRYGIFTLRCVTIPKIVQISSTSRAEA